MIFDEKYFLLGLSFVVMLITFCGIKIIQNKMFWLIGECEFNEKSSIFHKKMLKGLGIIYPVSIIPFFYFYQNVLNIFDYVMLILLSIVGLIDDKYNLSYKIKIIFFLLISFFFNYISNPSFDELQIINFTFKTFFFVFLIIFFNQIDGINGMAVLTFMVCFFSMTFLTNNLLVYLPLICCTIPYLFFNLRGQIGFQGDSGSYFLAGIIFIILIKNFNHSDYLILIFLLCPILLDLVATTLVKIYLSENIFKGHRDNIYQRLASFKKNHLLSTIIFIFFQVVQSFVIIYLFLNESKIFSFFLLAFLSIIIVIFFIIFSIKIHKNEILKIKK